MSKLHNISNEDLERLNNELLNVEFEEEEKIDKIFHFYGFEKINNVINTSDTSSYSEDRVSLSDFHLNRDSTEFLFSIEQDKSFCLLARDENDDFQTVFEKQTFFTVQDKNLTLKWTSQELIKEATSLVNGMDTMGGFNDKDIFDSAFENNPIDASIELLHNYTSYEIKEEDAIEISPQQILDQEVAKIDAEAEQKQTQSTGMKLN